MIRLFGLASETGRSIDGAEHLRQSLADLIGTRPGQRLMRRDYGCRLAELLDQPANPAIRLQALAAVAEAIRRWEPRIQLKRLSLRPVEGQEREAAQGRFDLRIEGQYRESGLPSTGALDLVLPVGGF